MELTASFCRGFPNEIHACSVVVMEETQAHERGTLSAAVLESLSG